MYDDEYDGEHIAPVYRAPVVSHGSDPIAAASAGIALSLVGLLIGLLAVAPARWQWVFYAITAVSAIGLLFACRAWYRAVFAPVRPIDTTTDENARER